MKRIFIFTALLLFITGAISQMHALAQSPEIAPPDQPVKLIFIHHSTGENWLTDGYGNLGHELGANNYFVSDTNYGWGPNSIGDRTDIVNWREWFRSSETTRYMEALYGENGQHANYTRAIDDPGGENQIVMFKSCFPNSALEGRPDDSPDSNEAFTVGHAKFVYNDLLNYFSTRPDKLFIVITAPPLQDSTYADNARAFNNWLVYDWLAENRYEYDNVAVFDFYNILTHPDNHHRVNDGQIEHTLNSSNTLYYDSDGDDHPNEAGSQKATAEFIPLLNLYYRRWLNGAHLGLSPADEESIPGQQEQMLPEETANAEAESPTVDLPIAINPPSDLIDDFEGESPTRTEGWQPYWDEATNTTFNCDQENGRLRIDFDIAVDSWATCSLFYDSKLNWSKYQGIAFSYQASTPDLLFNLTLHSGSVDEPTNYQYTVESAPAGDDVWITRELTWNQILGVDWENDARNPIDPAQITGVSFGFSPIDGTSNQGTIWIDNLFLLREDSEPSINYTPAESENSVEEAQMESESSSQGDGVHCFSTMGLISLVVVFITLKRKFFHTKLML